MLQVTVIIVIPHVSSGPLHPYLFLMIGLGTYIQLFISILLVCFCFIFNSIFLKSSIRFVIWTNRRLFCLCVVRFGGGGGLNLFTDSIGA